MKEFEDVLIRSILYFRNLSRDGGQIISSLNPEWIDEIARIKAEKDGEKFSRNPTNLIVSQDNLKLIALMINKNSFIHDIFWNSFAEAWGENIDLYLPFNTSELVSILKKFDGSDSHSSSESEKQEQKVLYNKLISFIGANGLLKKSSHIGIETPKELPGNGAVAALNYDFFKSSIIKESHETLLHGFLAIQGISPLAGYGRDKIMNESYNLNASDLDFLKRNYLVNEVSVETSSRTKKLKDLNYYEDMSKQLGKNNACLKLHTEQLEIIIGKVKKLINRLEKMQQPASDDKQYRPISTLKSYLRQNFEKLAYFTGPNSDFLESIYLGNKFFYKDNLEDKEFDKNAGAKNNVDKQLELFFNVDHPTDLDKIFMNSIIYLLDALRARRDVCKYLIKKDTKKNNAQNFKISFVALTNLAELSTVKTLKNELTRKDSGLIKVKERSMNIKVDSRPNLKKAGNNRTFIDMESAYNWLIDSKRTSTWKKVVLAPYLDKSLDYKDLSTLGDNFQKTLNENTKFSRTEKFSIESALHLNKNKGSTVAKALLDRFYEESEPFFKQKIN